MQVRKKMKRFFIILARIDPIPEVWKTFVSLINYSWFWKDFFKYKKLSSASPSRFPLNLEDIYPQLHDKTRNHGFDRHYIYHLAWAARILSKTKPKKHIDISSSLYFSTIISAFIPTVFYDFRPADIHLSHFKSKSIDLNLLPFLSDSIDSISCMHTLEHIGLGRYGDVVSPNSDITSMKELERVIKPGGNLIIVVPVGKPKIMFNAHRIYSYQQIIKYFSHLQIKEFSLIPDDPTLPIISDAPISLVKKQSYGCGCFWFTKKN